MFGNWKIVFTSATFDVLKKISFHRNFSMLSKNDKNIYVICKHLVSWVATKQQFDINFRF